MTFDDIPDTVSDNVVDEFIEGDQLSFDLTDKKIFRIASVLAIVFGAIIGCGYAMIFTQFPNLDAMQKINIMGITLFAGVGAGIAPALIKEYLYCRKHKIPFGHSQDAEDDETE